MKTLAVFCGRFNPLHIAHERTINQMIAEYGLENILIIIGSSNHPQSLRHFFSYDDRKKFIQKVYPGITVAGLPDYPHDDEWMSALDDIIELRKGKNYDHQIFYGGCEEDIAFFIERGREYVLINRFNTPEYKISATEVRDALISDRSIEGKINPIIQEDVMKLFKEKWEQFKKM